MSQEIKTLDLCVEKLAKMVARGVSVADISDVLNLSIGRVETILKSETFLDALSLEKQDAIESELQYDEGWDYAENLALSKVIENLKVSPDPDYAIKVATLANKAVRRKNKFNNQPIGITQNLQTVINLQGHFVNKLQQSFVVAERTLKTLEQKKINILSPKGVKALLQPKSDINEELDEAFAMNFS